MRTQKNGTGKNARGKERKDRATEATLRLEAWCIGIILYGPMLYGLYVMMR